MDLLTLLLAIEVEFSLFFSIGQSYSIFFSGRLAYPGDYHSFLVFVTIAFSVAFTILICSLTPKLYYLYICQFVSKRD